MKSNKDLPALTKIESKNEVQAPAEIKRETLKTLFVREDVKSKFQELLGQRSAAFMTSVLQVVAQSDKLSKALPSSVYHAACVAATLDLPLNPNLGFAYIVSYNSKQLDGTYKEVAQFQMGYKGFVQLAQRSGQFKTLNTTDVRKGEIKSHDRLTDEIEFEWIQDQAERLKQPIIAYVAYFKLLNGFEKPLLMYVDEIKQHGAKYSKTFTKEYGLWNTDFDGMAKKTVLKLLLSKFGPLSIEMQKAVIVDQAVINDEDANDLTYIDHEEIPVDHQSAAEAKENERIENFIQGATSLEQLEGVFEKVKDHQVELFLNKKEELSTPK